MVASYHTLFWICGSLRSMKDTLHPCPLGIFAYNAECKRACLQPFLDLPDEKDYFSYTDVVQFVRLTTICWGHSLRLPIARSCVDCQNLYFSHVITIIPASTYRYRKAA